MIETVSSAELEENFFDNFISKLTTHDPKVIECTKLCFNLYFKLENLTILHDGFILYSEPTRKYMSEILVKSDRLVIHSHETCLINIRGDFSISEFKSMLGEFEKSLG